MNLVLTQTAHPQSGTHVIRHWSEFERLSQPWDELHRLAAGSLFSAFDWLQAQQTAFMPEGHPHVVTIWREGRLAAAAPLWLRRAPVSKRLPWFKLDTLGYMSCNYTARFDLLAEDAAAGEALVEAIARTASGRCVDLEMMPRTALSDMLCRKLVEQGHRVARVPRFESSTIDAAQGFERYLAGRTKSFRKSLRRASRGLEAFGARYEIIDGADPRALARLHAISEKSWKHGIGTGMAAREDHRRFSARMVSGSTGRIEAICGIISGPQCDIALLVCLLRDGVCYGMWTEFDEAYERFSPGRVITAWMIRDIMSRGIIREIDLLRKTHFTGIFGEEDYVLNRITSHPRFGVGRLTLDLEQFAKRSLGGMRAGRRKSPRRADCQVPSKSNRG